MKTDCYFVGTPLYLTEGEAYHLHKYLKKGRAAGTIVEWGLFEFDLDALLTPVQLDCQNCHLAHEVSCCEGGFPFPPTAELLPVLDAHQEAMTRHLPDEVRAHVAVYGMYESHVETAGHPTIGTYQENCLFCRIEGNGPACLAHRYALQEGMQPTQIKPLSCLLYPLDLIADAAGHVFVTALNERTARFSRWGAEYRHDFLCANREGRERVAAGDVQEVRTNIRPHLTEDVFALERYRPAYVEGRETLCFLYGEELWQEIDARIRMLHEKGKSLC